ncbi:MAG: Ohr family peroxiredoxin [Proteobacteria bacterium]|nr:Ohr family peroxiredoxin [Pseudomonadota bacterium]
MTPVYTGIVTVTGGRKGKALSSDGRLDLEVGLPDASGGPHQTNPEQLFGAGYAACFGSAVQSIARRQKLEIGEVAITSHVSLGKTQNEEWSLGVELHIKVAGIARAQAEELVAAADKICPYSYATRGNIVVQLIVEDA